MSPDLATISENIRAARSVAGQSFDTVDLPCSSIGALVDERAESEADRPFIVYYDENGLRTSIDYREFRARVFGLAGWMRKRGLGVGDRIATLSHNHPDTVLTYFAGWTIGATIVPLNAGEDDDRLSWILENSGTRLLVTRAEFLSRAGRLTKHVPRHVHLLCSDLVEVVSNVDRFESAAVPDADALLPRLSLLDSEALIVYTSGTTGRPKGVVLTHGNLLVDAREIAAWHRIDRNNPMMCVLPIHHVNGTVVTLVTPLFAASGVVLNRKFGTSSLFERIAAERVGVVSMVPTLLAFLTDRRIDREGLDLSAFRHIICGAGPLTIELAERFESMYGHRIVHGYGLSETTCYCCFLPVDLSDEDHRHWMRDHGFPSIGVALPANEMAIHDEQGKERPAGERGEIVIRGHTVANGYFSNVEANRSAFAHGWFRSGDEGFYLTDDADRRFFFITGRLKELIIRGGVNLSPLEIDEVLNSHPGVARAVAVGFPNTYYGEEVGAYVERSDATLDEEGLLAWLSENLPFSKRPKVVIFGTDIPVTSTGKYQRTRLVPLFSEFESTQFRPTGEA